MTRLNDWTDVLRLGAAFVGAFAVLALLVAVWGRLGDRDE